MTSEKNNSNNNASRMKTKVFFKRESLITELLEIKHYQTIKNCFFALLFGLIGKDILRAELIGESVDFGLKSILVKFTNVHLALLYWVPLFGVHLLTYLFFALWVTVRIRSTTESKSLCIKVWDAICVTISISYFFLCLFIFPLVPFYYFNLGFASSIIILTENLRLGIKSYAFIRTAAPDILNYNPREDKPKLPTFRSYLYFSFAPTLVYRSEYPRTEKRNYWKIVQCFFEVLCCIWLQNYIFLIFFGVSYRDVGKVKLDWKNVLVTIVESSFASGLLLLVNFYLLLHAWFNGFAELLKFADRRFYHDWWIATNYSWYFRNWNNIVQDWLYEYIYRDSYLYIFPKNRTAARLLVFLLSTILHEQLMFFAVGYFLPIISFMFFVCGSICTRIRTKHPLYNIFMLFSIAIGNNILLSIHMVEYFARQNCPYPPSANFTRLVPRIITLDCV